MLFGFVLSLQLISLPVQKIQNHFKKYQEKLGLSVRTLEGNEVFSINGGKKFSPASVQKLVSSACVLESLGTDFKFRTPVLIHGEIKNHVLNGDLIIRGSGDFSLVIEDLKIMVEKIYHIFGIHEIKGKLLIDTSYLAKPRIEIFENFQGDAGRSFRVVLNALPINHNSFAVWVNPMEPSASLFPYGAVDLQLKVNLKKTEGRLNGSKTTLDYDFDNKRLSIAGSVGSKDSLKAYYRAAPDPYASFVSLFTYNFKILGGKFSGDYGLVSSTAGAVELFAHESRSLSRLFIDINKLSTNFGAEMSALAAASKTFGGKPLAEADLSRFVQLCPQILGLNLDNLKMQNASGLSRESRLAPSELSKLLARIPGKEYGPEYLSSLSILGKDGTTRNWLKEHSAQARLKTGSIQGVRSLAGYVYSNDSKTYAFALILNCSSCDPSKWRADEIEFLRMMIEGR